MKRVLPLILCMLIILCSCSAPVSEKQKLNIVTTIFPIYDFVRNIGGEKVDVKMLISPGCEVHTFDPAPSDMTAVYGADLFFCIGGESDVWAERLIGGGKVDAVRLMNSVSLLTEDGENEYDEHIWTSPENAAKMIDTIMLKMSEKDEENALFYRENAKNYTDEILQISNEIRNTAESAKNNYIVVADRFPFKYFADEYGIEYSAAFGGCAVSTDISAKTMLRLIDDIHTHGVKCAYYVEMSNKNIAMALSKETGIKLLELHSAHNVTLEDFERGITYLDIMKANKKALLEGMNL